MKLRESEVGELENHFCVFYNASDFSKSIKYNRKQHQANDNLGM
jgi:hypothetical protein